MRNDRSSMVEQNEKMLNSSMGRRVAAGASLPFAIGESAVAFHFDDERGVSADAANMPTMTNRMLMMAK